MKQLAYRLLSNWHVARVFQLIFGVSALAYGITIKDTTYNFVGVIFLIQAIFNLSLCGAAGCGTSQNKSYRRKILDVKEYRPRK